MIHSIRPKHARTNTSSYSSVNLQLAESVLDRSVELDEVWTEFDFELVLLLDFVGRDASFLVGWFAADVLQLC